MGPLYHLPAAADRAAALREAPGAGAVGVCWRGGRRASRRRSTACEVGAAATRRSSACAIATCATGSIATTPGTTATSRRAYLHRPEELHHELEAAGFEQVALYGVEGPGWMLVDFDRQWQDPVLRRDLLQVAAALEREPAVIGASAHLLAVGRKAA